MYNGKKWLIIPPRKIVCGLLVVLLAAMGAAGIWLDRAQSAVPLNSGNLIRFHVLANSDSYADQALKLKVRDEVIKAVRPALQGAGSIEEARKRVDENLGLMASVATQCIRKNGYSYPVKVMHGNFQFPEKTYQVKGAAGKVEDITLPPGEYEAVRVVIGEGKGANWWCVLFPPLCFVSPTDGEGGDTGAQPRIQVGNENSPASVPAFKYDHIDPGVASAQPQVEYKFKVVEWYRMLKNWI